MFKSIISWWKNRQELTKKKQQEKKELQERKELQEKAKTFTLEVLPEYAQKAYK